MKVEVTKTDGFTNRVLAHDGPTGLLVVDKPGPQEVVDHPRVRQLISTGTLKETKAKVQDEPEDPNAATREAEQEVARKKAEEDAKAEQERIDAEAKAREEAAKAKNK